MAEKLTPARETPPTPESSELEHRSAGALDPWGKTERTAPSELSPTPALDVEGPDYVAPDPEDTERIQGAVERYGPHDLEHVVPLLNPRLEESVAYRINCGPVSRAFADTYQGRETRAAPGLRGDGGGESMKVMTDWMAIRPQLESSYDESRYFDHQEYTESQWDKIGREAERLPDGTVITVGVQWNVDNENAGGHWFSAVKVDGKLTWVDAQWADVDDWPPRYVHDIESVFAASRADATSPWKELDLRD